MGRIEKSKLFEKLFVFLLTNRKVCGIVYSTAVREFRIRSHIFSIRRSTQVGRRGAPAKGVGRILTGARVQISPSPPEKTTGFDLSFFQRNLPLRASEIALL